MTEGIPEGIVSEFTVGEGSTNIDSEESLTLDQINKNYKLLRLPNPTWHVMLGGKKFIGFFKAEPDSNVKVKVVVENTLDVVILLHDNVVEWLQFCHPHSLNDVEKILESVERISLQL